jgi:hypothetical protein
MIGDFVGVIVTAHVAAHEFLNSDAAGARNKAHAIIIKCGARGEEITHQRVAVLASG